MAKVVAAAAEAKPLAKREPVLMGSAALTLISTALFVAPAFGIKIPDKAAKLISLGMTLAGGLGLRTLVKPV